MAGRDDDDDDDDDDARGGTLRGEAGPVSEVDDGLDDGQSDGLDDGLDDDDDDDRPVGASVRALSGGALAIRTPAEFETILGTADEITFDLPDALDLHHLVRGTTIAGHVVLAHHAEDLLGPTYVAYDGKRDRKVLLRLIPVDLESAFAGHQTALVESLAAIAQISHPCIVAVHDVGLWTGGVYVATEFVDGIALRTWIEARDDPFPWPEVLRIFREAARGIVAAHSVGVLHRDLSPDRILIGEAGQVKVADFGLAPTTDDGELVTTSLGPLRERLELGGDAVSSALVGTLEYAAPEVVAGAPGDHKSDQFAFCVALYETLYGERPFVAADRVGLAAAYLRGDPRQAPPDVRVPAWLRAVVMRGLSIRPADRWPSMEQLVRELDRDPAARRRRWQRALAVVAVFSAGAGAVVWQAERAAAACTQGTEAFNGVWDQARRAELQRTFLASNAAYAPQNFAATAEVIDTWAHAWVDNDIAACEARRNRTPNSEQIHAERLECLGQRQDELRALLAVLEAADPQQLDRASFAAESLTPSRSCARRTSSSVARAGADVDVESAEAPDPVIEELRGRIDCSWALLRLGAAESAGALVADVAVEALGSPVLRVSLLRLRGAVEHALGRPAEAEPLLRDAAVLASRGGLDHALVQTWTDLAEVLAPQPERGVEAAHLLEHAQAVMDRSRFDHGRWRVDVVRGDVAAAAGNAGDALLHYHAAMAVLDRAHSAPWARTGLLVKIGNLIADQGDITAALGYLQRAQDGLRKHLGPRHPALADILLDIGDLQARRGEHIEARTSWDGALAVHTEAHGPASATTTMTMLAIARRLRDDGDGAAALDYDRRALAAIDGGGDSDPKLRAAALLDEGRTLLALSRDGDAQVPLRQAFEIRDAAWRTTAKEPSATARREVAARWLEAAVLLTRALSSDPAARDRALAHGRAARTVATENGLAVDPWLVELLRRDATGASP